MFGYLKYYIKLRMETNCEGYLIKFLGFEKGCILRVTVRKNRPVNGELNFFKISQKAAFEAKGRPYTTDKVIQRLFIIELYT